MHADRLYFIKFRLNPLPLPCWVSEGSQNVKRRHLLISPALVLVAAFAVVGCGKHKEEKIPPPPAVYAEAFTGKAQRYVDTFGLCTTIADVTVMPQVTGKLMERKFKEGALVNKGDTLFIIEQPPFEAALEEAKGNYASAQASLKNSIENLQRQQELYAKKVVDIQTLQNAQAEAEQAQGRVEATKAEVKTAQINFDYTTITSPITGKTGIYLVDPGNVVTEDTTELINIQTISPIYVDYTLSENAVNKAREYLHRNEAPQLDVEITIPDLPDYKETGTLEFLDNQINPQTGTMMLRALVENKERFLWPGMFVDVRLILTVDDNALLIPARAVMVGQKGKYVFLVEGDKVKQQYVELGEVQDENIVVESGLKAGDKVVTKGQVGLTDGKTVKPTSADAEKKKAEAEKKKKDASDQKSEKK